MFDGGLRRGWIDSGVHAGNIRRAAWGPRDPTPVTGRGQENDDARTGVVRASGVPMGGVEPPT